MFSLKLKLIAAGVMSLFLAGAGAWLWYKLDKLEELEAWKETADEYIRVQQQQAEAAAGLVDDNEKTRLVSEAVRDAITEAYRNETDNCRLPGAVYDRLRARAANPAR